MNAIELSSKEFYEKIQGDTPVLVDFWAPWCVYCRRIAPAYEKIAQQYEGKVLVTKVNIDEVPDVAIREHIEVIPTLVLYRNGKALNFVVAPESKAKIEEFIDSSL